MALGGIFKAFSWFTRFLQFAFAAVILGITAYFVNQFRDFRPNGPREVVVPLVFSVFALVYTLFAIFVSFFWSVGAQVAAAVVDFVLFVGYLASTILLRWNFGNGYGNRLLVMLVNGRLSIGKSRAYNRHNALVRLLTALVVIQMIMFFFTTLMQLYIAKRKKDEQRSAGVAMSQKRFSSRSHV